jgi:excisionase family DNA binding protein
VLIKRTPPGTDRRPDVEAVPIPPVDRDIRSPGLQKLLGIGRSTAYELVHTGDIPSLRLGRRMVVPVCQVRAMLGIAHDETKHIGPRVKAASPDAEDLARPRTSDVEQSTLF